MGVEEHFPDAFAAREDGNVGIPAKVYQFNNEHHRLERRNKAATNLFLDKNRRAGAAAMLPGYYGELLSWALQRHMEREHWKIIKTLGYHGSEPVYTNVSTDYGKCENLLVDGQLLIQKGGCPLIVTVDIKMRCGNSVRVEGSANEKQEIGKFIDGVKTIAKKENFYRNKKIEFSGRLRFLDVHTGLWDSIALEPEIKAEIKANTIGLLNKRKTWNRCGIPLKRCVLLVGEPGIGKTTIWKALMAEAVGITCIITSAYNLDHNGCITELYQLAQDLSPCIVFIEDIDLIGQSQIESGSHRVSALLSLVAMLSSIEEHEEIVTVATASCLDTPGAVMSEHFPHLTVW